MNVSEDRPERICEVLPMKDDQKIDCRHDESDRSTGSGAGSAKSTNQNNAEDWVQHSQEDGALHIEFGSADAGARLTCGSPHDVDTITNCQNLNKNHRIFKTGSD